MTYYGSQMRSSTTTSWAAKAALESAVRYLAAELGPKGIAVPAACGPAVASGIPEFDALLEKAKAKRRRAAS